MTDEEIERLLLVRKTITNPRARGRTQKGSKIITYEVTSEAGPFQIYLRQNERLSFAFSCGLLYLGCDPKLTLARYNGRDHLHSNPLESGRTFQGYHIHRATARYIEAGRKAEHYAELTDRFADLNGAMAALMEDCNVDGLEPAVKPSDDNQHKLF